MDPLIPLFLFLFLSAFFSGIETAFAVSNKLKIEVDKGRNLFSANLLSRLIKNYKVLTSTLWLGNIISMVAFALYADIYLEKYIPGAINPDYRTNILIIFSEVLLVALIYLLFAGLLPSILFRAYPNRLLKLFALPVYLIYLVLYPVIRVFIFLGEIILKYLFRIKLKKQDYSFSATDFDNLLDETNLEPVSGEEQSNELQMFRNARDLSNIKVREFMVPRNEIVAISNTDDIETLGKKIVDSGHSKILVYDQSIDNVIGYTHAYDIFARPDTLMDIIKPVIIVPGSMTADKLLNTFIIERKSVALVVDEFGGTAGMLTIEDILEEIFGDISDEYDTEEVEDKQISENEYLVSGRLDIDYLNEKYNLGIPESDDYLTIAGYILQHHENIPFQDEEINIDNFSFIIKKASESRIEQILIKVSSDKE